jgi:hypothetical protein
MQSLAGVENSDLLDKKVVRRNTDTSLILDPNMSLVEELVEYLSFILELPEDKLTGVIGVFNDYFKKIDVE